MMHDIYNGPKFQSFLRAYYSPAGSFCGALYCICIAVPCLMVAHSRMKGEVGQKLSAWNRVLTKQGCGVTMQINEHGLVFNISPQHTLKAEGEAQDDELIRELGLQRI
ncbi:hypothetical protein O6H91_Y575900 [Diphasiastrum complanatum]|nr:hypothetical protein O6H91_Y575900 [Diphasiastrum complanatum]